jgi:thiol-disulfide isomerase/thioredoxin
MVKRPKLLKLIILYILIVAAIMSAINCASTDRTTETAEDQLPAPSRTAPDFELQDLDGQLVSLRDFRGSPVLLNFWATWCGPCRFEMPFIQQVYEDSLGKVGGLVILAVNLRESPAVAEGFLRENGFTFPVLLDSTREAGTKYNIRSIPTTFFIDENGIIKYIDVGAFRSKADLEQRLSDLIINDE